jgi:hypothetical protein
MSLKRSRKVRRVGGYERFVALPHFMLGSPAWLTMSPNAKALLIDVWRRHNGVNNGEISYSVREAAAIGLGRSAAARAFRELVGRGFLRVSRDSCFAYKMKKARTWVLTAERINDEPSTRDFMRWTATPRLTESKPQSRREDAQSHSADAPPLHAMKLSESVTPAGLSIQIDVSPQSHQRDTYILPGGGE